MPLTKREPLSGWGNCPKATCTSYRPEKRRDLREAVLHHQGPLIARGLGRAYGDAALQPNGVLRSERLDHYIELDLAQGIVRAQAGVTLADIMARAIPQGWLPPVLPGTRHVTLGGAFACNVHGKNHFRDGDFAEHVLSVRLLLADGSLVDCSPALHSELFWATAGGMGMTGVIEELTLKLKPISSASLKATSYRVGSIEDMIAGFEHYRSTADYMVGWIDHMGKGSELGRGLFEAAIHLPDGAGRAPLAGYIPAARKLTVPFFMPSFLLNRYAMACYNKWRFRKYSTTRETRTIGFDSFFHPLDSIGNWNKLYGKRGFFQYQCVLPESAASPATLRAFLTYLHKHHLFSFLAVIKYHREGKGYLTFPIQGYSLALDFPNTRRVRAMLPKLDRWVAEHGGRTYLAKDTQLTPDLFAAMYGEQAQDWLALLPTLDPARRFSSLMSQRLQWKKAAQP